MSSYDTLSSAQNVALIGASPNKTKYAYKIYNTLKNKGKTTFGVHPTISEIEGDTIYPNLQAIETPVDLAVFVVRPEIGMTYLPQVVEKGIETIWLQPGTVSDELVKKATELGLNVIEDCVLVQFAKHQ